MRLRENDMKRVSLLAAAAAFAAVPAFAQPLHEGHLAAIDTNGDGSVSLEEYDAYGARAFQRIDVNGDRVLSPEELKEVQMAVEGVDSNGDGTITRQEFGQQMTADFNAADRDGNGLID
jgi:Ca2+-binding EF-hand superfamily protein